MACGTLGFMKTCTLESCDRKYYGLGYCSRHYQSFKKWGDSREGMERVDYGSPIENRLRHHGWTVTDEGCWEWGASRNKKGYGTLGTMGQGTLVHRLAYELWVGPIPDGMKILHRCDNPPCMNPEHLRAGTQAENVTDMVEKGRLAVGTARAAKLSESDVVDIRWAYKMGASIPDLVVAYPVGYTAIRDIVLNLTWKHLP